MKGKSARRCLAETVIAVAIVARGTAGTDVQPTRTRCGRSFTTNASPTRSSMATRKLMVSS